VNVFGFFEGVTVAAHNSFDFFISFVQRGGFFSKAQMILMKGIIVAFLA